MMDRAEAAFAFLCILSFGLGVALGVTIERSRADVHTRYVSSEDFKP